MFSYIYLGLYSDLDFENFQSINALLDEHSLVVGQEPFEHAHVWENKEFAICNAILASRPGHPFWQTVFSEIIKHQGNFFDPVTTTGPSMIRKSYLDYNSSKYAAQYPVWLAPVPLFYPLFSSSGMRSACNGNFPSWLWDVKSNTKRLFDLPIRSLHEGTCNNLRARDFKNSPIGPESIAAHQWSHTWSADGLQSYLERKSFSQIIPHEILLS